MVRSRRCRDRHLAYRLGGNALRILPQSRRNPGPIHQAAQRLNRGSGFRRDDGVPREESMAGNYTICAGTIGSGLWLSADGGESWRRVMKGLGSESRVFGLTVCPHEPRTVFAGADDGIYKSSDGGQSFERLDSPMNRLDVWK